MWFSRFRQSMLDSAAGSLVDQYTYISPIVYGMPDDNGWPVAWLFVNFVHEVGSKGSTHKREHCWSRIMSAILRSSIRVAGNRNKVICVSGYQFTHFRGMDGLVACAFPTNWTHDPPDSWCSKSDDMRPYPLGYPDRVCLINVYDNIYWYHS